MSALHEAVAHALLNQGTPRDAFESYEQTVAYREAQARTAVDVVLAEAKRSIDDAVTETLATLAALGAGVTRYAWVSDVTDSHSVERPIAAFTTQAACEAWMVSQIGRGADEPGSMYGASRVPLDPRSDA